VPPLVDATIATVRTTIAQHEIGIFQHSSLLAERLERSPRIMAALGTRTRGMLGLPFSVLPAETNRRRAESVAKRFEEAWPTIAPQGVIEELLRQRVLCGIGLAQVVWSTSSREWLPRLVPWHLTFARWVDNEQAYDVQTRDGRIWVRRGDPRWFILGPDRGWMRGVVRCLSLEAEGRELAVRDWARWSEKHGLPITIVRVPASASETDKSRFLDNVAAMGSESTILAPGARSKDEPGFDIDLKEVVDRGWQGFDKFIDVVATDVSIAITGHNLTTEVKGGSLAAAQVGDRVRYDYLEADVDDWQASSREQFIGDWAEFNAGDRSLAPWLFWNASPPEDTKTRSETHKTAGEALLLLRNAGVPVDVRAYAESFGIPMIDSAQPMPVVTAADPKTSP
jgi:phage gp29-like protein